MSTSDRNTAVRRAAAPSPSGCTPRSRARRRPRSRPRSRGSWATSTPSASSAPTTRCSSPPRSSSSARAEDQLRALGEAPAARRPRGGPEACCSTARSSAATATRSSSRSCSPSSAAAPACRSASSPVPRATSSPTSGSRSRSCWTRPPASSRTPTTLGVLQWRCGHQVAAELLDELQPRYERIGDLARALHVARMRTTLPFEDTRRPSCACGSSPHG